MFSDIEKGENEETERYPEIEITEFDDLFHMNGGIPTFRFLS